MSTQESEVTREKRASMASGLRDLANDIEAGLPLPYAFSVQIWWAYELDGSLGSHASEHVAREAMDCAPGAWSKYNGGEHVIYTKRYGDHVRYEVNVNRDTMTTCEKVITGYRTVPATKAHTEPIYEWKCQSTDDTEEVES